MPAGRARADEDSRDIKHRKQVIPLTLERLNEHLELRNKLARAQEMVEAMRSRALPGAQVLTGMLHAPGVRDKIGDLTVEIVELTDRVNSIEAELKVDEMEILAWLQSIEDDYIRLMFRLRFIRRCTWGEVAQIIGGNTADSVRMVCYRYLTKTCST